MGRQRYFIPALTVAAMALAGCGSDGGGATFADQLQDSCRTLARSLREINEPTSLDETEQAANDASSAYDAAVADLKKLSAPSKQGPDFKQLQNNFADEVDLYVDIAKAARAGDAGKVASKLGDIATVDSESADLADSLQARVCQPSAVIIAAPDVTTTTTETTPPTEVTSAPTDPPETFPPLTDPPVTAPPPTQPAETFPPPTEATTSPSDNEKAIIDRSGDLVPQGDYSFIDSGQDKVALIRTLYAVVPKVRNQTGTMFGVDVLNNGVAITRVVVFQPDAALLEGSAADVVKVLASGTPTTDVTYGALVGTSFQTGENLFFISDSNGRLVLAVGKDEPSLNLGTTEFAESYT